MCRLISLYLQHLGPPLRRALHFPSGNVTVLFRIMYVPAHLWAASLTLLGALISEAGWHSALTAVPIRRRAALQTEIH